MKKTLTHNNEPELLAQLKEIQGETLEEVELIEHEETKGIGLTFQFHRIVFGLTPEGNFNVLLFHRRKN
jgi:hypothetical protein